MNTMNNEENIIYDVPYAWRVRFEGAMTVSLPDEDASCKYVLDLLDNLCNFGNELSVSAKAESCYCYQIDEKGHVKEKKEMNKLMTAAEARKQTKKYIDKSTSQELKKIYDNIERSIMKGEFECYVEGIISDKTKEILEARGFQIVKGSQYNDIYYLISWKTIKD